MPFMGRVLPSELIFDMKFWLCRTEEPAILISEGVGFPPQSFLTVCITSRYQFNVNMTLLLP